MHPELGVSRRARAVLAAAVRSASAFEAAAAARATAGAPTPSRVAPATADAITASTTTATRAGTSATAHLPRVLAWAFGRDYPLHLCIPRTASATGTRTIHSRIST